MTLAAQPAASRGVPLSVALIRQHVRALRRKVEGHRHDVAGRGRVFGIRTDATWSGPASVEVDGSPVDVVGAVSALHVRELMTTRASDAPDLVLITSLDESQLGLDVVSRLALRRLAAVEPWALVLEAFRARDLDARLLRHRWMALALLETMPLEGYPPVPAGVLDSATAWGALLEHRLHLRVARPDPVTLLDWACSEGTMERLQALPAEMRAGVGEWLAESAGPAAMPVLAVAARDAGDAVPMGLVCDVLSVSDGAVGPSRIRPDGVEAAIRIEALSGGQPLLPTVARQWAEAALALLRRVRVHDQRTARAWHDRAQALLRQLGAEALARHSDDLPPAFEQRCEDAAAAVGHALDTRGEDAHAAARSALDALRRHRMARDGSGAERLARLEMALRLVNWLREDAPQPGSLADAARWHVRDGSFADWAAGVVRMPDPSQVVTDACARVQQAVRKARATRQTQFATLLAQAVALDNDPGVLTVERVLADRVAQLASHASVLLVVMDGMSAGVAHELVESLQVHDWLMLAAATGAPTDTADAVEPVLSLLPSITSVCRTSLLTGTRKIGTAATEQSGFAAHEGLLAHSDPSLPPALFHKSALTDAQGALTPAVRTAIAKPRLRVVGAVVNAVDDHLLKADQVRNRWRLEDLPVLGALLHAAREANRLVVLTADHGHVIDDASVKRGGGTADRWRPLPPDAGPGEVLVRGPRVLSEGDACVLAVAEQVRYQTKKNGYHGGGSPQEVVAPFIVLAPRDVDLPGWGEATPRWPLWWDVSVPVASVPAPSLSKGGQPAKPSRAAAQPKPLISLFDDDVEKLPAESRERPVPAGAHDHLAARLVASQVYAAQKAAQVRGALDDERSRVLVSFLLARGGRATRSGMAAMLGIPALRLRGQVNALRSLLNVENYAVLEIDEASDTVVLNRELLVTQFEIR